VTFECNWNKDKACEISKVMDCRWKIIECLDKSAISKSDFINRNIYCIKHNGIKPYENILKVEEGFYNYFYYNTMAKSYMQEISNLEERFRKDSIINSFIEEAQIMYKHKDRATEKILELLKYKKINAYYVSLNSEKLDKTLFEIELIDFPQFILHSKKYRIKDNLIKNNCFKNEIMKSKINSYVNTKII